MKRFGPVVAHDAVDTTVRSGEVPAPPGGNGPGTVRNSEDLAELLSKTDRLSLLFTARLSGVPPSSQADRSEIGRAMAGSQ
jgi:ABC-type uncharacterized transport system ATPase subunit